MHLRLFELAKDHLRANGIDVLGGIISPVHDAYQKKDLISAQHRIKMAELAVQKYDFVKCSKWEAEQSQWIRTRQVLDEYSNQLAEMAKTGSGPNWLPNIKLDDKEELPQIFLVCGGDLIETFSVPGLWQETDITAIVRDYGLVVITREGSNPEKYVYDHDILHQFRDNIHLITERIPNDLSSTRIRKAVKRNESIRFLVPDLVINYIEDNCLYKKEEPNSDK